MKTISVEMNMNDLVFIKAALTARIIDLGGVESGLVKDLVLAKLKITNAAYMLERMIDNEQKENSNES